MNAAHLFRSAVVFSALSSLSVPLHAVPFAYDMVGSSSQNLVSYVNPWTNAFSSPGDAFQIHQRGVSPAIPFALLDDTVSVFPPDALGIIGESNTDTFFGIVDTTNSDNSGPVSASWSFDIRNHRNLSLSIDMGAMGDFESSDAFNWSYQIDGGPAQTVFASAVDEAGSQTYTMDSGSLVVLNDPMLVGGTMLTNQLQTLSTVLAGHGNNLTLTLTAQTNGGSEAIAFQNLVVDGDPSAVVAYDMVGSSSQNLLSYTNPWTNAFSSAADSFQIHQRGVSPAIPFALLDDTVSIFPPDTLGIIGETNTDTFFGVVDTENGDNTGPVSASWLFDINGFEDLELSIDMGAMGDFEASDFFTWTYQIDGGPIQTAFASLVDEAGVQLYTLESGTGVTLNDPMLVDGIMLSNILQTLSTQLLGTGNTLLLSLTASFNGGSEALAFQNIVIRGAVAGDPVAVPLPPVLLLLGTGLLLIVAGWYHPARCGRRG